MLDQYFTDKNTEFEYVNDRILWDKIFTNPIPKDFTNPGLGEINLSHYFNVEEFIINTSKGKKPRKLLSTEEKFYLVNEDESIEAFLALRNLLIKFKRPYRDCYVRVPNHPDIEPEEEFLPADIYYSVPQYPLVNETKTMMKFALDEDTFDYMHAYCFGFKFTDKHLLESFELDFSVKCFCGFLLHY